MKFYYILILFALLASCETVIDVEIPREAPKLVVNAQLVPDSTIILHLSESRYILDDYEFKAVSNATLTVLEDGIFKEQLQKTEEDGIYASQSILQEGKTYTLKAEATGFAPVEASSFIAPKVPIQNIVLLDSTLEYTCGYYYGPDSCVAAYSIHYDVNLTLKDPANSPNYYSVIAYAKRTITEDDGTSEEFSYEIINQLYLNSEDISVALADFDLEDGGASGDEILFSDEIFDGKTYTFNFEIDDILNGPYEKLELIFLLKHLSEARYKYQVSRELQEWNDDNPFAEPVPIYNNIENGYGIFAGYSADSKKVAIP